MWATRCTVSNGVTKPIRLTVAGTATMPAIGTQKPHLEMGSGALLDYDLIPATARNLQESTVPGPNAFLIRLRPGANPTLARRSLSRIESTLNASSDGAGGVVGVLRPAEIANYRSIGTLPGLLGGALAAGAVIALGLTLVASVRRRRRDLALLKTLGFTQRQLAATVAWQSTVAVGLGIVVGVPLGIVVGRSLWNLFAARHPCGAVAERPHPQHCPHRPGRARTRQRRGGDPGPDRGEDPDCADPASRIEALVDRLPHGRHHLARHHLVFVLRHRDAEAPDAELDQLDEALGHIRRRAAHAEPIGELRIDHGRVRIFERCGFVVEPVVIAGTQLGRHPLQDRGL